MKNWTAAEILAVFVDHPERLFSSGDAVTSEYQALAKLWHPDVNKAAEATAVLTHLNLLRKAAEWKIAQGHWDDDASITFTTLKGVTYRFRCKARQKTEYGELLYGPGKLVILLRRDLADLVARHRDLTKKFSYANIKMEEEIGRYLPSNPTYYETADYHVIMYNKTPDVFLLRHTLGALGGKVQKAVKGLVKAGAGDGELVRL